MGKVIVSGQSTGLKKPICEPTPFLECPFVPRGHYDRCVHLKCKNISQLLLVDSFCYLGDILSAAGGCELATTTRLKATWKKFKELLLVFSSCHLSYKTHGCVYS